MGNCCGAPSRAQVVGDPSPSAADAVPAAPPPPSLPPAEALPPPDAASRAQEKEAAERSRRAHRELLATPARDFLVDRRGHKVKVDQLKGKPVALLFSAQSFPPARGATAALAAAYAELRAAGKPFEVVYVSNDPTPAAWQEALAAMPWLALPFADHESSDALGARFGVREVPTLVLLDREGGLATADGVEVLRQLGTAAYPFSVARLKQLRFQPAARSSPMAAGHPVAAFEDDDSRFRRSGYIAADLSV
eukprot:SM000003S11125  [mRNA]  locus=s3:1110408:1111418:+ [translate_table: standard]